MNATRLIHSNPLKTSTPAAETEVSLFKFKDNNVRVVEIDRQLWFVAIDVCRSLSMANLQRGVSQYLGRLNATERQVVTLERVKGNPNTNVISESGLYKLVMRSDKPEAREFQDWVTKVVLPAIRRLHPRRGTCGFRGDDRGRTRLQGHGGDEATHQSD